MSDNRKYYKFVSMTMQQRNWMDIQALNLLLTLTIILILLPDNMQVVIIQQNKLLSHVLCTQRNSYQTILLHMCYNCPLSLSFCRIEMVCYVGMEIIHKCCKLVVDLPGPTYSQCRPCRTSAAEGYKLKKTKKRKSFHYIFHYEVLAAIHCGQA